MREDILELARTYASETNAEEVKLLRTLGRIPAPTRDEGRRATFVRDWLLSAGADPTDVAIDAAGNVILRLGVGPEPLDGTRDLVVYAAHMDVVFPDTEPLPMREEDGRLYAPGIGDDTANLVGLMLAARWLLAHPKRVEALGHGILVVANVCEEGLGNLDGTKEVFAAYGHRVREFVTFDTHIKQLYREAVGSHRWRLAVTGPGGHSLHDYGRPNAIALMAQLVGRVLSIDLPGEGTTCNVGRIEGGTTVNSIPARCEALYEYRSGSEEVLLASRALLESEVAAFARDACDPGVEVSLELLGVRPGTGPVDERAQQALVRRCSDVMCAMSGKEPSLISGSTDANVPLSLGIPACCVGTIVGDGMHTRGEWIDLASLPAGLATILAVMLEA